MLNTKTAQELWQELTGLSNEKQAQIFRMVYGANEGDEEFLAKVEYFMGLVNKEKEVN
jgi:hypothetical protein